MSAEDLEKYETEMELSLYREYKDIVGQFSYVVETERRFYLANSVEMLPRNADGEVTETRPVPDLAREQIDAAFAKYHGDFYQMPPMVSAIIFMSRSLSTAEAPMPIAISARATARCRVRSMCASERIPHQLMARKPMT